MNRITRLSVVAAVYAVVAVATTTVPETAWAQSNVTVYGVADAGLVRETGGPAGSLTNPANGLCPARGQPHRVHRQGDGDRGLQQGRFHQRTTRLPRAAEFLAKIIH
jgi:hypothetical protein